MRKFKIWASIPLGNGQTDEMEEMIELEDGLNDRGIEEATNYALWDILYDLGVLTAIEEIDEE